MNMPCWLIPDLRTQERWPVKGLGVLRAASRLELSSDGGSRWRYGCPLLGSKTAALTHQISTRQC